MYSLGSNLSRPPMEEGRGTLDVERMSAVIPSAIGESASPDENLGPIEALMRKVKRLSLGLRGGAAAAGLDRVLGEDRVAGIRLRPWTSLPEAEGGYSPQTPLENANRAFPRSALQLLVPGAGPLLELYRNLPSADSPADFAMRVLEALDITVRVEGGFPEDLPSSGPLLLAANHPFGGVDGLIVAALGASVRPDLKILANRELCRFAELRSLLIPVDVFGKKGQASNVAGLLAAIRHVESGGALAVFPAGVVSHWHSKPRRIMDPEWHPLIGRLTRTPDATVIPLFFEGGNSLLFQAAGCLHPALRTILLPWETWRMRQSRVTLRVGNAVKGTLLSAFRDDKARTAHLRARCYALGRAAVLPERRWRSPVAAMRRSASLVEEFGRLPSGRVLAEDEKFQVFHVVGDEAPNIMHEIGRRREEAFRSVLEGSGKELDLDHYDPHYDHLVLWDKKNGAMAGGYRTRRFSPAEPPRSIKTLYTASLFRFQGEFFRRCGVSMELGRAFVTLDYQRGYAPLMMLWRGICRLAAIFGARTLFGPTSIGLAYAPESILMLRQHLEERHFDRALSSLVRGRREPALFQGHNAPDVSGLEYKTLDHAVKDLEGGLGLPVLFKHYLQLGGRVAAFHEDRQFGTVDALVVVDLAAVPVKLLKRLTGEDAPTAPPISPPSGVQ